MTRSEMLAWLVKDRYDRIRSAVAVMEQCGVDWIEWARVHGFPPATVTDLIRGGGPIVKGESGRAADMIMYQAGLAATVHLDAAREDSE